MEDLKKKYEDRESKKTFQKVELDLKLLIDTHKKLASGNSVEPKVVNTLLLGGIANILCQSELFDNVTERVKVLEIENIENKLRLESLENWLLKLNDKVNETIEKMETLEGTHDNSDVLEEIETLRGEIFSMKESISTPVASENPSRKKSCSECGETFERNFELENHMVDLHGKEKTHACEICGKTFYLRWRLQKHSDIHENSPKPCKYFQGGKACPFAEVGCKFLHEQPEPEDDDNEEDETEDNLCYYCNKMLRNQQDLIEHMGNTHMDRFQHLQQSDSLIVF